MRKLATAAAVSLALASGGAFGLGLGDIEMRSALNQPMNAEIPLTSARAEELDGMIVKLADADAFERAGIERTAVLTSLRFAVENEGGRPVIRVTSPGPVVEPFLNFLLEVDWPQGRMVREYTVLLDPPVFMTQGPSRRDEGAERGAVVDEERAAIAPAPIERSAANDFEPAGDDRRVGDEELIGGSAAPGADAAGEIASLEELQADSASLGDDEVVPLSDAGAPNAAAGAERSAAALDNAVTTPSGDERADEARREVRVERGDTLYEIAEENLAERTTVEQMMLALLDANRTAFINENVNLVRAGSILRVPRDAEVRTRSQAQALAEIGRQSDLWREYRDNLRGTTANTRIANRADPVANDGAGRTEVADAGTGGAPAAASDGSSSDGEGNALSPEARQILESAREEVRNRDELRIVADDTSSEAGANAAVDREAKDQSARLGEINRQLQLAREELSSSRLEGGELDEQASELQSTSENLDALVALRQNEIARLEDQLAAARVNGRADEDEAGASEAIGATVAAGEAAPAAADETRAASAEEGVIAAGSVGSETGDAGSVDAEAEAGAGVAPGEAGESVAASAAASGDEVVAVAERAGDEVMTDASDAASELDEEAANALGAVGETSEQVDPVGDAEPSVAAADAQAAPAPWYRALLEDPVRLGIAGAGAIGLLGLGALLMRRRGKDDEDGELAGFEDGKVEFIDEEESATLQAELDAQSASRVAADKAVADEFSAGAAGAPAGDTSAGGTSGATAAGATAAGVAAAGAAAGAAATSDDAASAPATAGAEPDKDDTISEVDVYLAYGLHGQAEELLVKANESQPDNKVYAAKLLQTYHAQGNAEAFVSGAEDFRARFGDSDAAWADIAGMGRELRPDSALFLAGNDAGETSPDVGVDREDAASFDDADFILDDGTEGVASSVSRDFSSADEPLDFDEEGFGTTSPDADDADAAPGAPFGTSDVETHPVAGESASLDGALRAPSDGEGGGDDLDSFELSERAPDADSFDALDADDETLLMDQSLDPAFAFDEGDLEATGDFSRIADELADENVDGSIDFPGPDESASAFAAAPGADPAADGSAPPAEGDRLAERPGNDPLDEALTLDELDVGGAGSAANEADGDELDIGSLSDDLALDLAELDDGALDLRGDPFDGSTAIDDVASAELDGSANELDPLDMTMQNELLDGTAAPLDSEDEMETMMDLAKAYIDMGDKDSASNALDEVVKSGSPEQVSEAETLLQKIS